MREDLEGKPGEGGSEAVAGIKAVAASVAEETTSDDGAESLAEFDEVIVQKGDIVFVADGEDFLKIPVELKVNLSCSGGEERHGFITAIGWIVPDYNSLGEKLELSGGRIGSVLSKWFFDIGVSCGRATVLNYVVDRFYRWLRENSARFEVGGSGEVGFADVAAKRDRSTVTIP